MQIGIFLAVAFFLQVSTALLMRKDTLKDLDGNKYDILIVRNGEEIISKNGQLNEIAVPLKEQGLWVVIKEDNPDVCYVVDMTNEDTNDRPSDGQFKLLHYEAKAVQRVHPDIKRTCEEYGGEGRTIVEVGPKEDSNPLPPAIPFFQGYHSGRIVKRYFRLRIIIGRLKIDIEFGKRPD
ncbi:uncharacterized protein LOC121392378 isoform X2 [Gigantopelta aegis]|uniref:uncharacterized protein LOC121392378 isoform X2 n=1 Tax=Gigantopelta aegis TaxID=1735272 RepID=UPI001B88A3C7|nr:uncharacterized protein LOC121392378 isoform X2 [Gigantopelta aegis]